ncbi:MAG TPA: hypothetical protein VIR16_07175 [Candidatus Limnocylindrales bacterium]
MTDEQFDRDLRATLDKLMAEPAPATLRARVERTLATGEGRTTAQRRPRLWWLAAALVVAVIVATPLVMNVASRQPGVAGQASPSAAPAGSPSPSGDASSSPGAASPSPSPVGPTAAQIGLPVVDLSQDVVRKTRVDTMHEETRDGGPLTGPYLYQWPQGGTGTSRIVDIGGGSIRIIDPALLPVGRDEAMAAFAHDGGWMAMLLVPSNRNDSSNVNDCRSHPAVPIPWRIEVAPMGADGLPAGAWREVASGTERSPFKWPGEIGSRSCPYALAPVIAISGDDLAWSSSSSEAPNAGSDVTIVSLATGAKVASFRSATRVLMLRLSATALAWLESANGLDTSTPQAWVVMEARLPGGVAAPVDIGTSLSESANLPVIALDGTALVAAYSRDADSTNHVVRIDGGRTQVVSAARFDQVGPWRLIAANAGRVVLECQFPGKDSGAMFLAVWTADGGLRTVTVGGQPVLLPPEVTVEGDWVTWFAVDFPANQQNPDTFFGDWTAIPIDALAAPDP